MDDSIYTRLRRRQATVPWRQNPPARHLRQPLRENTRTIPNSDGKQAAMYQHLGAHLDRVNGVDGTRFAVWAPNAREVSVLCDKTHWQHGNFWLNGSDNGIWTGFVPGIGHGAAYKFGIRAQSGQVLEKADPYAFFSEM